MEEIWQGFIGHLSELRGLPPWLVILAGCMVIILVGGTLLLGYMVLKFGDKSLEMFLPYMRQALSTLRSESTKTHPAIVLEMRFERFLGAVIFFCLAAILLHALFPWVRESAERTFLSVLITSGLLFISLLFVSLKLSVRMN